MLETLAAAPNHGKVLQVDVPLWPWRLDGLCHRQQELALAAMTLADTLSRRQSSFAYAALVAVAHEGIVSPAAEACLRRQDTRRRQPLPLQSSFG